MYIHVDIYMYKVWCISSGHFFSVMIQRTGRLVGYFHWWFVISSLGLPNSWHTVKISSTYHIQHTRLCAMVGTGFFRFFFSEETHVAPPTRRPRSSNYPAQTRPDACCKRFVVRLDLTTAS